MSLKLIACGFDETLYSNRRGTISQRDKQAIDKCQKKGVKFVLTTGRTLFSIKPYYKQLGLNTPVISSGGAEIYDQKFQLIYRSRLSSPDALALLKWAEKRGVYAQAYIGEDFCYLCHRPEADFYIKHTGLHGFEDPGLLERDDIDTCKILMCSSPEHIDELQHSLSVSFPYLHIAKSIDTFVECFNKGTSKGTALRFLAEHLGCSMSETAGLGDTQIDLSLFEAAAFTAAPANATEEVQAAADVVLNDCDHDFVAQFLEEYVFPAL